MAMAGRGDARTGPDQQRLQEVDARYVRSQMKKIKRAKQDGEHGKAERLATELLQYLGLDEDAEMPVLEVVQNTGFAYKQVRRDIY